MPFPECCGLPEPPRRDLLNERSIRNRPFRGEEIGFDADALVQHGLDALEELKGGGIVLGTRRT